MRICRICVSDSFIDKTLFMSSFIAELRRAKRAREAPWVRKNGNSSSRENLVMTSAYERPSGRTPSVQTMGEEEGRLEVSLTGDLKKCHLFLARFVRKSTIGDVDLNFEDRIFFSTRT